MLPMTDVEKENWRKRYRETVEALERAQAKELAAMTEEEALQKIRSIKLFAPIEREQPDTSGLVEQQALFHHRKKR